MEIKKGDKFRHFKGNVYEVITLAKDSSDLKDLVVYQNNITKDVWVRPLDEFLSKVDKVKYPNVKDEYRFTKI